LWAELLISPENKALQKWGLKRQTEMCIEEAGEFLSAWNKIKRSRITEREYCKTGSDQAGFMITRGLGLKYGPFLLLKRCFEYQKRWFKILAPPLPASVQADRKRNLKKCNSIFLTGSTRLRKKLRPGRQDGQDIVIRRQNYPDNPVNPV
jgi:hypothetical protein